MMRRKAVDKGSRGKAVVKSKRSKVEERTEIREKLHSRVLHEKTLADLTARLLRLIRRLEKEKNGSDFSKLQKSYEEQTAELLKVKNELAAQTDETADLKEVRNKLSVEQAKGIKLTADKRLLYSELGHIRHDLEEEKDKSTCKICYTQLRDAVCLPCMHFLYCTKCLQKHQQRRNTCPTCRSFTIGVLKCNLTD